MSGSSEKSIGDQPIKTEESERLFSVDMLRGLVIVLMALDHARLAYGYTEFYPTDISMTTVGFFLTRWVTHFCAPVFVFLAGTGIFLRQERQKNDAALSRFLLTRGLWLLVLEIFWVNIWFSTAAPWQTGSFFVQVLWVLGISMICMALLVRIPLKWVLVVSLVLIFGHNLFDGFTIRDAGSFGNWWAFLHFRSQITLSADPGITMFIAYPFLPWLGVMGAGYALGSWMILPTTERRKRLFITGVVLTLGFLLLRFSNWYGDPAHWMIRPEGLGHTVLSFLNTTKYPASLLFLLMTIGPALILLAWFEGAKGVFRSILEVYGRVPMFYYLIHLPMISVSSVIYWDMKYGRTLDFMSGMVKLPGQYQPSLETVYIAWIVVSVVLFPICLYYGRLKFSTKGRLRTLLSYF